MMEDTSPIRFSKYHSSLVVGVLDIVHSTQTTMPLSAEKIDEFYTVFLEEISGVLSRYNVKIIKNMGDGLLFYFPQSIDATEVVFEEVVNCGRALLDERSQINNKLSDLALPTISYRISMSYGPVSVMLDSNETIIDLFGSTVNTCAKINKLAEPDTLIVGQALYEQLLKINTPMHVVGEYKLGETLTLPVYVVGK
jgi:class 3 adenylate cyclase